MEIYYGGAGIVVLQKFKGETCVLLGERADGQGLALPAGKKKVADGILKFTALRELKEECGFIIPQTPEYQLRVEFAFRNFAPFKRVNKESGEVLNNFMAISEVYKFELREDEDLTFFMNKTIVRFHQNSKYSLHFILCQLLLNIGPVTHFR